MFRYIMMSCGYVEGNYTSWLLYTSRQPFEHRGEAIKSLAVDLYNKFWQDELSIHENKWNLNIQRCCIDTLYNDKTKLIDRCPSCQNELKDQPFEAEEFQRFICDLHSTTADSYGEAEYGNGQHFEWYPWSIRNFMKFNPEEVIWIVESAELVLMDALIEAKPELADDLEEDWSRGVWFQFRNNEQPTYS